MYFLLLVILGAQFEKVSLYKDIDVFKEKVDIRSQYKHHSALCIVLEIFFCFGKKNFQNKNCFGKKLDKVYYFSH